MLEFLQKLFEADFMPHRHCYFSLPDILWTQVISDGLITLSYYSIPLILFYFIRKRPDFPFKSLIALFAAFILACGTTHLLGIVTQWMPVYRLASVVKALTAGVSIVTAIAIIPVIPKALALRSPKDLEDANLNLRSQASALRESEERFRTAFEEAAHGIALLSNEGKWLKVNHALCQILGYTEEELVGMSFESITHPDDRGIQAKETEELLAGKIPSFQMEKRYIHKDGHVVWTQVSVSAVRDTEGRPLHRVSQIQDITQRIRAERSLKEQQAFLEGIYNHTSSSIFVVDVTEDGKFRCAGINPSHAKAIGLSNEMVVGKTLEEQAEYMSEETLAQIRKNYQRCVDTGEAIEYEEKVSIKGRESWWLTRLAPQKEEDGRVSRIVGTGTEITQRIQSEEEVKELNRDLERRVEERTRQLSQANVELARSAQLKDEFLAGMSHELRTPLNAVLGMSEALLEEVYGPLNEKQTSSIHNVQKSGKHLLELINDILDLSKISAGKLELHYSPVDVAQICESSLQIVRQTAQQKRLSISSRIDASVTTVRADALRLKQILVNLLSNAVKFTPEGGEIGLDVEGDAENTVVRFTVWDTGIGISKEATSRLFKPFVQLDSKLSRKYEGSGLGLSLVHMMTELHGGSVALESEPDKGSRFSIALPWQEQSEPLENISGAGHLFPKTALIIEDAPEMAEQLSRYLEDMGTEVTVAGNGETALEKAQETAPELILLDIALPGMSGWDVLKEFKTNPQLKNIPVIAITVIDERHRGFEGGVADYIVKPVSRSRFYNTVKAVLKQGSRSPFSTLTQTPEKSMIAESETDGYKILLAEDNEANISTLTDYLEAKGFHITIARDGAEAIARAQEVEPDLILMDIQMPGTDGLQAMRAIRADAKLKDTPIIALTALAMSGDRERCMEAGANDYMTKPVGLKNLAAHIDKLLKTA